MLEASALLTIFIACIHGFIHFIILWLMGVIARVKVIVVVLAFPAEVVIILKLLCLIMKRVLMLSLDTIRDALLGVIL